MPDLNDNEAEWAEAEMSLFWKFAQVTQEEYTMMYREILSAAVRAAISGPTPKKAAPEEAGDEDPGVDMEESPEEDD
jgi:hypothetical protein